MSDDPSLAPDAPDALERLLVHTDWLRALARRLVRDAALADDLVQETWVVALRTPPLAGAPVRPWLGGVLKKLALMQRRTDGRRDGRERRAARDEALPSTAELVAEVDLQRDLSALVLQLDEPVRTTVLLRFQEGLSSAEIARRQGLPAGTVRWRLKRGIDQLRAELDARPGGRAAWLGALAQFGRLPPAAVPPAAALSGAGFALALALAVVVVALVAFALLRRGAERPPAEALAVAAVEATAVDAGALGAPAAVAAARVPVERATERGALPAPRRIALVDEAGAPVRGATVVHAARGVARELPVSAAGRCELPDRAACALFIARPGAFLTWIDLAEGGAADGSDERILLPRGRRVSGAARVDGRAPDAPLAFELDSDRHLFEGRTIPPEVAALLGNGRRARAVTDDRGAFVFHGLAPDWSGLLWLPLESRALGADRGAYGDESRYLAAPTEGLVVELAPRARLTGRVVDADGAPVPEADVRLHLPGATAPRTLRADGEGRFDHQDRDGALAQGFAVEVASPGGIPATFTYSAVPPAGALGDLAVGAGPRTVGRALAVRVAGTAASAAGAPAPAGDTFIGVRVSADAPLFVPGAVRGPRPFLQHGAQLGAPTMALYLVAPGATLELEGLAPGTALAVQLEDAAAAVLAAASVAPSAAGARHTVELALEAPLRTLDVRLVGEGGELLIGGVVTLASGDRRGVFRRTGLDGTTGFTGLARSRLAVDLYAQKRGYVALERSAVALPAEGTPLVLTMARGHDLSLQVTDAAGAPLGDVTAVATAALLPERAAQRAPEHRLHWMDLPAGEVTLRLQRRGVERELRVVLPMDGPADGPLVLQWE